MTAFDLNILHCDALLPLLSVLGAPLVEISCFELPGHDGPHVVERGGFRVTWEAGEFLRGQRLDVVAEEGL